MKQVQFLINVNSKNVCSYKSWMKFSVFQPELLVRTGISGIIHLSYVVSLWIVDTLLHTLYLTVEVKRRKRQSSGKLQCVFPRRIVCYA